MKQSRKTRKIHSISRRSAAPTGRGKPYFGTMSSPNICINAECKLRKAGCSGFEGCPGFKGREGS